MCSSGPAAAAAARRSPRRAPPEQPMKSEPLTPTRAPDNKFRSMQY